MEKGHKAMQTLKHPYLSVKKDSICSYGGNQMWARQATLRDYGCGAVAGTDLLLYLHRNHPGCTSPLFNKIPQRGALDLDVYNELLTRLCRRFFLVLPYFGMAGVAVSAGLNYYFRANGIPLRADWSIFKKELWRRAEEMLTADLPVILAVGPNVPCFWEKHKVRLYTKTGADKYQSSTQVKAHFVTITGMDGRWLRVSSWGREYYIQREEYTRYIARHSSYFVSNLVFLRKRD